MGRKALNQFGIEDCSPLFPCKVCVLFNEFTFKKYPKGMDPNIRPYELKL